MYPSGIFLRFHSHGNGVLELFYVPPVTRCSHPSSGNFQIKKKKINVIGKC